jgi:hypothetical protein
MARTHGGGCRVGLEAAAAGLHLELFCCDFVGSVAPTSTKRGLCFKYLNGKKGLQHIRTAYESNPHQPSTIPHHIYVNPFQ